MEWLSNLMNGENGSAINLVLITLALVILLIVVFWIFRKVTGTATRRAMRSRVPRLSITDSTTVDEKRYLVMVRRDNIEHLLLIGGANDLVVESNIVRAQSSQKPTAQTMAAETQPTQAPVAEEITEEERPSTEIPIAAAAAAGTAGLAAVAATASETAETTTDTLSTSGEAVVETVSEVAETATDVVAETVASAPEAVSDTFEKALESVESIVEPVSISQDEPSEPVEYQAEQEDFHQDSTEVLPEVETVEVAEPEPVVAEPVVEGVEAAEPIEFVEQPVNIAEDQAVEVSVDDIDLESTISEQLDNALSNDALELDTAEATQDTGDAQPTVDMPEEISLDTDDGDDEMQRLLNELTNETKQPAQ